MKRIIYTGILAVMIILIVPAIPQLQGAAVLAQTGTVSETERLLDTYTQAQGRFIENIGQFGEDVFYAASSEGQWIYFYRDRIVVHRIGETETMADREYRQGIDESFMSRKITHPREHSQMDEQRCLRVVRLYKSKTSDKPRAQGQRREQVHYFNANTVQRQRTASATWDTLLYRSIDNNIDLIFYFSGSSIRWVCQSKSRRDTIHADCPRDLDRQLHNALTKSGQAVDSKSSLMRAGNNVITYSTLLGGSKTDGIMRFFAIDETTYLLVGNTKSPDFPVVGDPWDDSFKGDTSSIYAMMIFVACLDMENKELLFSTYFGGSDLDAALAADIDASGNIVIAGSTWSDDLPVTPNAWQPLYKGNGDGYIAALNSTGSELVFCSYIGGTGVENLKDIKIDANGDIVITGLTDSWNYPTTPGVVQGRYGGGEDDVFVTRFNHDVSELIFSTFVGGQGWDEGRSLRFTPSGDILVAGYTNSNDFPLTANALYGSRESGDEGCVFILTAGGRRMVYSTYVAWDTHEDAWGASLDENGVMTVFGITTSTDLPTNERSFQNHKGEHPAFNPTSEDFYVLKYRLSSGEILACTYLGGAGRDRYPSSFTSLSDGKVLLGGSGTSKDYPTTAEVSIANQNDYAIELSILDSALTKLIYSVRYGGSDYSYLDFAAITNNRLILSGFTRSTDYPVTTDAWQSEHKGMTDSFFTIIDLSSVLTGLNAPVLPTTRMIEVYPQPASSTLHLVHRIGPAAHVTVTLHDYLGRMVRQIAVDTSGDGLLRVELDVVDLRPGIYDCRITTDGRTARRMVSIVR